MSQRYDERSALVFDKSLVVTLAYVQELARASPATLIFLVGNPVEVHRCFQRFELGEVDFHRPAVVCLSYPCFNDSLLNALLCNHAIAEVSLEIIRACFHGAAVCDYGICFRLIESSGVVTH